jgi:hypothetical protein
VETFYVSLLVVAGLLIAAGSGYVVYKLFRNQA